MAKLLNFGISTGVAAFLWLCLFPITGSIVLTPSVTSLLITTLLYGVLTGLLWQTLPRVGILLLRGANLWVVLGGFIAMNVLAPLVVVELSALLLPGVSIGSHWTITAVIVCGMALQFGIDQAFAGLHTKLEKIASLKKITATVTTDGVFRVAVSNGELVSTERLIIPTERLAAVGVNLGLATSLLSDGQGEHADRIVLEAIPELKECGYLGLLRLNAAYRVLQQSHAALGKTIQVAECQTRIDWLNSLYAS